MCRLWCAYSEVRDERIKDLSSRQQAIYSGVMVGCCVEIPVQFLLRLASRFTAIF